MWHCPNCGAPQAETARCWVCHRSSTTCSTCRHFRRSLAAEVGWCAFDPKRSPLTGLEQRGCWEERRPGAHASAQKADLPETASPRPRFAANNDGWASPGRDFVPVELLQKIVVPREPDAAGTPAAAAPAAPSLPVVAADEESWAERTSLFGDGEA